MNQAGILRQQRREVLVRIEDLEMDLVSIAESTAESPDDEHDPEGSTVGFERARVGALLHVSKQALADIDRALQREESGKYGVCEECGLPIPQERLEAVPTAERCVRCITS